MVVGLTSAHTINGRPDRRDWVTSAAEEEQGSGILAATSGQPHLAVLHYSRALRICPNAAVLYLRRCAHLQPILFGFLCRLPEVTRCHAKHPHCVSNRTLRMFSQVHHGFGLQ